MPIRADWRWRWMRGITYERLGSPEGELAIAQSVVYLALCTEEQRGVYGLWRGDGGREEVRYPGRSATAAQRADRADERAGVWAGISVCAR